MKIYTKTGDKGTTSLIGGKIVSKADPRIEAYGTVDELIAFIGLLRDQGINPDLKQCLLKVQGRLMTCAAMLASDPDNRSGNIPSLSDEDVIYLENEIDRMNNILPELKLFILPGGHQAVSLCNVARTVCRRAERRIIELDGIASVPSVIIRYMNRLSDYLFVLSRVLIVDFQTDEIKWTPDID